MQLSKTPICRRRAWFVNAPISLVSGQTVTGDDFGNHKRTAPSGCTDRKKPVSRIKHLKLIPGQRLSVSGTSTDRGPKACRGLKKVLISLARVRGGKAKRCRFAKSKTQYLLTEERSCRRPVLFKAKGLRHWKFTFDFDLPAGCRFTTGR